MIQAPQFGLTVTVDREGARTHMAQKFDMSGYFEHGPYKNLTPEPVLSAEESDAKVDEFESVVERVRKERAAELANIPDDVQVAFSFQHQLAPDPYGRAINQPVKRDLETARISMAGSGGGYTQVSRQALLPQSPFSKIKTGLHWLKGQPYPLESVESMVNNAFDVAIADWKRISHRKG